jgi:hypothetical protein
MQDGGTMNDHLTEIAFIPELFGMLFATRPHAPM